MQTVLIRIPSTNCDPAPNLSHERLILDDSLTDCGFTPILFSLSRPSCLFQQSTLANKGIVEYAEKADCCS
jgi:hypothetical protein